MMSCQWQKIGIYGVGREPSVDARLRNLKPECHRGLQACRNLHGHIQGPHWFPLTLRVCLDKSASVDPKRFQLTITWRVTQGTSSPPPAFERVVDHIPGDL